MTMTAPSEPRAHALPRETAMRLAATEYQRFAEAAAVAAPEDWTQADRMPWLGRPCDGRACARHGRDGRLDAREQLASIRLARRRGGVFIDALTGLQVDERAAYDAGTDHGPFAARAPKAARARRRTPGFIRRRAMPEPQHVGGRDEEWTLGYLIDMILTRDPWMHRADIVRATGARARADRRPRRRAGRRLVAEWA